MCLLTLAAMDAVAHWRDMLEATEAECWVDEAMTYDPTNPVLRLSEHEWRHDTGEGKRSE